MPDRSAAEFSVLMATFVVVLVLTNIFGIKLFHFWRRVIQGRHLWFRNNVSTMTSQLVDTIIANSTFLGFGLGLVWTIVFKVIVASDVFKLLPAEVDTPFVYLGIGIVRRLDPTASAREAVLG